MGLTNIILQLVGASRTLGLAARLIPLIGKAYDASNADEWIFEQIKHKFPGATFEEMKAVIEAGKEFTKACYAFFHK